MVPKKAISSRQKPLNRSEKRIRASSSDDLVASAAKPQPRIRLSDTPASSQRSCDKAVAELPGSAITLERRTAPTALHLANIDPANGYLYFDKITILIDAAISKEDRAALDQQCDNLDVRKHGEWVLGRHGFYQVNIYAHVQRIEAKLPRAAFIEYFANRDDAHLSNAEIAADLTFDNEQDKYRLLKLFERHLLQPRQNKKRPLMLFDNGGISINSKRKGSHYFTGYVSKECRIDGIADCWHFEGRHRGKADLAHIGLYHPRDLASFNHEQYWRNWEEAGHLMEIDFSRLGRYHSNKLSRQRRKQSDQAPFYGRPSVDHWLGLMLWRIYGMDDRGHLSIQTFIRNYGRGPYLRKLGFLTGLGFI